MFRSSSDGATHLCRKASSIRFTLTPEGTVRAAPAKRGRRGKPQIISARLSERVTLAYTGGKIIAQFADGYSVNLGPFSAAVAERAPELRTGLALSALV